jgi:hypothetical protein
MKPRHAAALAGIIGILVPTICLTVGEIYPSLSAATDWLYWLWRSFPGFIEIMVVDSYKSDNGSTFGIATTIIATAAINGLLYAGIGWVIGFLYSSVKRLIANPDSPHS